jgi:hypothetical protein
VEVLEETLGRTVAEVRALTPAPVEQELHLGETGEFMRQALGLAREVAAAVVEDLDLLVALQQQEIQVLQELQIQEIREVQQMQVIHREL